MPVLSVIVENKNVSIVNSSSTDTYADSSSLCSWYVHHHSLAEILRWCCCTEPPCPTRFSRTGGCGSRREGDVSVAASKTITAAKKAAYIRIRTQVRTNYDFYETAGSARQMPGPSTTRAQTTFGLDVTTNARSGELDRSDAIVWGCTPFRVCASTARVGKSRGFVRGSDRSRTGFKRY